MRNSLSGPYFNFNHGGNRDGMRKTKEALQNDLSKAEINLKALESSCDHLRSENIDLKAKLAHAEKDLLTLARLNGESNLNLAKAKKELFSLQLSGKAFMDESLLKEDHKQSMLEYYSDEEDVVKAEGYR